MQLPFRRSTCVLLFGVVSFFASSSLRADVTGSILGVVRDATQAVVAGARIVKGIAAWRKQH